MLNVVVILYFRHEYYILMHFLKKHPKLLKFTCLATVSCGAAWLGYQIKVTHDILDNALDTGILLIGDSKHKADDDFFVVNLSKIHEGQDLSFQSTWSSLKFSYAKRLLTLAKNENKYIRKQAVKLLSQLKNLEYWHCSLLSQMIDPRTAVALARSSMADHRLIEIPNLKCSASEDEIVDLLKDLLVNLHTISKHQCMGYFIAKAFSEFHEMDRFTDNEYTSVELKKYIKSSQDIVPLCLESLLHHASIKNYGKHIADLNGLPILMEIHNRFKDNPLITAAISRILSYLSMHQELLIDIYKSGWIGVLAEWLKHDDVRVSIPAAKALANFDLDEDPMYFQRLYPLYPLGRIDKTPIVDVVFVHGFLGGVFYTWRQRRKCQNPIGVIGKRSKSESLTPAVELCPLPEPERNVRLSSDPDVTEFIENLEEHTAYGNLGNDYEVVWEDIPINSNQDALGPYSSVGNKCNFLNSECYTTCWPRDWLPQDCNDLRVIGVNFQTNFSMWMPICPLEKEKMVDEKSDELIEQLMRIGLGKRPIVWVAHSMGGLLVKSVLNKAYQSNDKTIRNLCSQSKAVIFYSTPHLGTNLAKFSQASSLVLWPSMEVKELELNSPHLIQIHQNFLEMVKHIPMKIITFIETQPTVVSAMKFKFQVVDSYTGNPGCGEYYEIPLDHLGICKPSNRSSFIYQKVLHTIRDIVKENSLTQHWFEK